MEGSDSGQGRVPGIGAAAAAAVAALAAPRPGRPAAALVNLSGQAVGISLAGAGTGLRHTSFAVPINQALAVARGIQAAIRAESLAARNIHAKMKRSRQTGMPRITAGQ